MTRTERMICFLSLGSWCVYKAYRSSQEEAVRWDWLALLLVGITALLLFTWIAGHKDTTHFKKTYRPTLPGTVFVLTIAGLFFLQNSKHQWQTNVLALDHQEIKQDTLTLLDQAKADRALQTWLARRSLPAYPQSGQTSLYATKAFAQKP